MPRCTDCGEYKVEQFPGDATICGECDEIANDATGVKKLAKRYRLFATEGEAMTAARFSEARHSASVLVARLTPFLFAIIPHADKARARNDLADLGFTNPILTFPHGDASPLTPQFRYNRKRYEVDPTITPKEHLGRETGPAHRRVRD